MMNLMTMSHIGHKLKGYNGEGMHSLFVITYNLVNKKRLWYFYAVNHILW